ncbi:MAG: hypothetical protein AAFY07_08530 [Pseudomonadota bacterium]
MDWIAHPPRKQSELPTTPYDRWVSPGGVCMAEFHHGSEGYLVRFPGQADFLITGSQDPAQTRIEGWQDPACPRQNITSLFHNAIVPILGNHHGGLFLHGSAVRIAQDADGEAAAIAFLGLSRGGKTTLAGSFAKAGHAFMTEDVIDLSCNEGVYWLEPKRSKLRLFIDSAQHLLGEEARFEDADRKQDVNAGASLPFFDSPVPLRQIYVLGADHKADLSIRSLSLQEALTALMPHAFILDVEDKPRLRAHFSRIADLSRDIGCYALDYRREYAELPGVHRAILDNFAQ